MFKMQRISQLNCELRKDTGIRHEKLYTTNEGKHYCKAIMEAKVRILEMKEK
jgi:hypothetical protein